MAITYVGGSVDTVDYAFTLPTLPQVANASTLFAVNNPAVSGSGSVYTSASGFILSPPTKQTTSTDDMTVGAGVSGSFSSSASSIALDLYTYYPSTVTTSGTLLFVSQADPNITEQATFNGTTNNGYYQTFLNLTRGVNGTSPTNFPSGVYLTVLTLSVSDASGFPSTGSLYIFNSSGYYDFSAPAISYTKVGNTFTLVPGDWITRFSPYGSNGSTGLPVYAGTDLGGTANTSTNTLPILSTVAAGITGPYTSSVIFNTVNGIFYNSMSLLGFNGLASATYVGAATVTTPSNLTAIVTNIPQDADLVLVYVQTYFAGATFSGTPTTLLSAQDYVGNYNYFLTYPRGTALVSVTFTGYAPPNDAIYVYALYASSNPNWTPIPISQTPNWTPVVT